MGQQRISFFPDGLRVMIIDDDAKAVRRARRHCPNCSTQWVSGGDAFHRKRRSACPLWRQRGVDVQAILCDVHKVVSSGFDFRRVIESELCIPVIYLLSKMEEDMVAGEDAEFLNHLLLTATYIVRKPLNPTVMAQLWRVAAWRRCCLEERIQANVAAHAGTGSEDDDDDDVVIIEEPQQVHFKAEFRAKHQKKDMADEWPLLSSDSMFLKAILPTLNVSPENPLTLTGGAGSSSVAAAGFAGGSTSPAAPLQVPVFQQQSADNGNAVISFNSSASPMAMRALAGNTMISFNNVAVAPVANAVISFNKFSGSAAVQVPDAMGKHLSGDVRQLDFPQQKLYFGPFSYQGPLPPSMRNHINLLPPQQVGMAMDKGKAPLIELPYGCPWMTSSLDKPHMAVPDHPSKPLMPLPLRTLTLLGEGSEKNAVAATNNAAPLMVPDQVAVDAAMDAEEDIMFSLESLLGLDYDMLLPMEDGGTADAPAAGDAASGSLDGEEGGMDIGWDLDLDDILVENANDFTFLDNLAGSE
uniref:Response regulatory domain-containing protein n=1 Tax=Oryza punctata TaxID=4537 RepID=A0A0E0LVL2_ORYPU